MEPVTKKYLADLKELATGVTTETLHGPVPTKTTMELASGVLTLFQQLEPTQQKRGLVIISALINFIDFLRKNRICMISEKGGGKLVMQFLENHSPEKNYFMQAEDIANRLGVPFEEDNEIRNSGSGS